MIEFHENNDMKTFEKCASCETCGPTHILKIGPISIPLCRDCMIKLMNGAMDSVIYRGQDCSVKPLDSAGPTLNVLYTAKTNMPYDRWLRQLCYVIPRAFEFE